MATTRRVPKIVKGNDFTGLVPLVRYRTSEGQTSTGPFPIDEATSIEVNLINENQQRVQVDWETVPDRDDILLIYVKGTLTCGFWGLEITGLYLGNHIRSYVERLFELVHSNEQANTYLTDDGSTELDPVVIYDNVTMALGTLMDGTQIDSAIVDYGRNKYLSKENDDTAAGLIRFLKGIQIGDRYVSGLLGEGGILRKRADGKIELVVDILYSRMKAYFDTVEIRKHLHSAGNRVASAAGAKCVRVEYLDANGSVTDMLANTVKFRCYFKGTDGEQTCTNDFQIGDQAFCKVTNAASGSSLYQHNFWRLVIGRNEEGYLTEDDEYWIDLSNREYEDINGILYSGYLSGSEAPREQDDIVQLGNKIDTTRQGAIMEEVTGSNTPSYKIYQNVNDYTLADNCYVELCYDTGTGRASVKIFGDAYIGDKGNNPQSYIRYDSATRTLDFKGRISASSSINGQTIDEYIASHSSDWSEEEINALIHDVTDGIQAQIDGQIETWFYNYSPVAVDSQGAPTSKVPLNVAPYSTWTTDNDKIAHLNDTFTNNASGYCWRFTRNEATNAFEWSLIEDSAVITALQNAARAQDTADGKRRVFICDSNHQTPTPPYDQGDLWVNVKYPFATGATYNDEILKCITSKSSGSFSIDDWSLANGYTKKLQDFVSDTYTPFVQNIQGQVDKKAETWRQATDPSLAQGWNPETHVGDIWMDISENGGNKTYIYQNMGTAAEPNYRWEPQDVPEEVFDAIDGKAEIFVQKPTTYNERDMWIIESGLTDADMPTGCKVGDIVVSSANSSSYNKAHWSKKDRYTDDTRILSFLNGYTGNLTNFHDSLEDDINAAGNRYLNSAVMNAIRNAVGGTTVTEGGLMLTSLLAMRKFDGEEEEESDPTKYTTWGGMSGVYDPIANVKGHGIASWYGGGMVDLEDLSHYWTQQQIDTWNAMSAADKAVSALVAKSLFRMDGSGYVASGNISWDADGTTRLRGVSLTTADGQTTIQVSNIASITYVNQTFLKKDWFNQFIRVHYTQNSEDKVLSPNEDFPQDATDKTLESVFSFWTNYGLTALGKGIDGTHVVGVLDDLNDVTITNPQTNQVLKYNGTQWVNAAAPSGASALSGLTDVAISSLADKDLLQWDYATGKWKNVVLSTAMSAYALASSIPTNVSQLNNDSGFITSAALSGYATQQWVGQQGYALTSQIPTNNNQLTNGAGYITSSGSCASAGGLDYKSNVTSSDALDAAHWAGQLNAYVFSGFDTSILSSNGIIIDGGWASTDFGFQILIDDDPTYIMGLRQRGHGVWSAWKRIPMGDGTGASGTWGIDITGGAGHADYLSTYDADGNDNLSCLQSVFDSIPKNVATAVRLRHGSHSMAIGWFLGVYPYSNAYGGWFISDYGTPSFVGVDNGYWYSCYFITTENWSSYIGTSSAHVGYADNATSATNSTNSTYATFARYDWQGNQIYTSYLKLSGGTMTGMLQVNSVIFGYNYANSTNAAAFMFDKPGSCCTGFGAHTLQDTIWFGACLSDGSWVDSYKQTWYFNGTIKQNGNEVIDSASIGNQSVSSASTLTTSRSIWGKSFNGSADINGTIYLNENTPHYFRDPNTPNWRGGMFWGSDGSESMSFVVANSSTRFQFVGGSDILGWGSSTWRSVTPWLEITSSGISSSGGVTALSDERHKRIVDNTRLQVSDIAKMRAVRYIWDDGREDKGIHVGSIAQDWQQILPEVVLRANNAEGTLSLQYGVAALISSITIARKVVDHEQRIKALENRCAQLERENEQLRLKIA